MIDKIKATINKYNMLSYDDYIAVAFSGGADSTALLDILHKEGYKVAAIHVNHMIRDGEADRDEEFCRSFCKERSIPFFCHHIDVPARASESGEGLEEAARRLRYEAIEKTVAAESITKVATAHHADDNAETVIFNIVRGSGAKGGCGIPPIRGIYVRPLIEITREDVVDYCRDNSLYYVTDSTNLSTDYTRNYIRHEIMPRLRQINPTASTALGRFSSLLRRDEEALEALVPEAGADRYTLAALPDALLSRYIRSRCEEMGVCPLGVNVEALMKGVRTDNRYITIDMGKDIVGVCDRDLLTFRKKITGTTHKEYIIEEGISFSEEYGEICVTRDKELDGYRYTHHTCLDMDRIKGGLYVRSRRDGDRYHYCGMTHSLKKLFNSRKIPVEHRAHIPLICDEEGIVWIPGFPPSDKVKADKRNKNTIYIGYNERKLS